MSLDALIRLQAQYNQQDREGIRQLGEGLGNILQQGGMADFEKNAMDILREGTTPEAMQRISEMYPNIPKREIWKYASEVGKQTDAQKLKDVFKSFQAWKRNTPAHERTSKNVQLWMESQNLTSAQEQVIMQNFRKMIEFSNIGEPERGTLNIGARGYVETIGGVPVKGEGGKPVIHGAPPEKETKHTYDIIENKKTGEQKYIVKGSIIPTGWKISKPSPVSLTLGGKPAAATERTAIANSRASISSLDNLNGLFNKAYVGPVAGRAGKVGDVFGFNKQARSQFNAATAAFKNSIIKQITGAQMSEKEATRILKQVPDVTDPPSVWKAKWEESKKNVMFLQKEQLRVLGQSGIRVPSGDVDISIQASDMSDADLLKLIGE